LNFWSGPKAPRLEAWSLDRNQDRTEGERLLKARSYAEAQTFLERAALDAEKRGHSTPKRIQVRLLLAEAQRKHLHLDESERTLLGEISELPRRMGKAERVRERIASLTPTAGSEAATVVSGGAGS
jgi:hypothetical protein